MSRFAGFTFKAPKDYEGRPVYTLPTVPARDLGADDVAALSDEQYEAVKIAKMPDSGELLYEPVRKHKNKKDAEVADEHVAVESEEPVAVETPAE